MIFIYLFIYLFFRRGNIPGYSGCVLFSAHHPTHSREPDPKAATTARIHRYVVRSILSNALKYQKKMELKIMIYVSKEVAYMYVGVKKYLTSEKISEIFGFLFAPVQFVLVLFVSGFYTCSSTVKIMQKRH